MHGATHIKVINCCLIYSTYSCKVTHSITCSIHNLQHFINICILVFLWYLSESKTFQCCWENLICPSLFHYILYANLQTISMEALTNDWHLANLPLKCIIFFMMFSFWITAKNATCLCVTNLTSQWWEWQTVCRKIQHRLVDSSDSCQSWHPLTTWSVKLITIRKINSKPSKHFQTLTKIVIHVYH